MHAFTWATGQASYSSPLHHWLRDFLPLVCDFLETALGSLQESALSLTVCLPEMLPSCAQAISTLTEVPVILYAEITALIDQWQTIEKEIHIHLKGWFSEQQCAGRTLQLENKEAKWVDICKLSKGSRAGQYLCKCRNRKMFNLDLEKLCIKDTSMSRICKVT